MNEIFKANVNCYGETYGRPKTVTTSDPIPKAEHIFLINAKFFDLKTILIIIQIFIVIIKSTKIESQHIFGAKFKR